MNLMKDLTKLCLWISVLALISTDLLGQTAIPIGPQINSYTASRVRGYHFTAPVNFTICEILVPNNMNNNQWHVEVVRLTNGPPPAYPGTTNNFVSLFYANNVTGNTPIACNIPITAGELIGIYGSRSTTTATTMANSYGNTQYVSNVYFNNMTLFRSGMQFPLNNQQMHDIWSEVNYNIGRIIAYYDCNPCVSPTLTTTQNDVLCNGDCTGDATVNATGGQTPYTYNWSNGQTTQNSTGLCAGTYTVTVTENAGCTAVTIVTITEPPALIASISASNGPLCNGGTDGDATVSASGGTTGYTYAWSSGGNSTTETGLSAGTYTVTVTDNNGCTTTATVTITEPAVITLTTSTTSSNCGQADGYATVSASGGTSPYAYAWSSGGNAATETGLASGTYTVTVTDNNGCTQTATVTVVDQGGFTATIAVDNNVQCNGACDGQATVSMTGGQTPFTFLWSSGGNAATEGNLCQGTYTVTVTDNVGCTDVATITITEPPVLTATITGSNDVLCNGGSSGDAAVAAAGGTTPYSYAWSSGGNGTTETGLSAGTYTVTVTDNNGCTQLATVSISEPPALTVSIAAFTDVLCAGGSTGDATVSATGGTPSYSYAWSSGGNTSTENGLTAGTYTVTVTDNNGCTSTVTVTVSEPALLNLAFSSFDVICNAACDGYAIVIPGGGVSPYNYNWLPAPGNGQGTPNPTSMCAGSYTLTVTDDNGCTVTQQFVVNEPTVINPFIVVRDITCPGDCDGVLDLSVVGGQGPYTYLWNNGETSEDLASLCVDMFDVTVTDASGCTMTSNAAVNVGNPNPMADFVADPWQTTVRDRLINFYDNSQGTLAQWSWTFFNPDDDIIGGANEQNPVFEFPGDTGWYPVKLMVTTDAGCVDDTTLYIYIDGIFHIFAPNAFTPNGDGINDFFFPQGVGINEQPYTLYIFDRWGEIIFESNNFSNKWDGTAKGNKEMVKQDVYVWKLKVNDATRANQNHEYVGRVTVVR